MVGGYTLRYALEHPAVGRVTVIGRRKVGAGNMPAAEKIGGDHSARAKIIGPLNPPGGITGPVMRNKLVAQIHPRMPAILPEQHHAAWLGETDDGNLKDLLGAPPKRILIAHPCALASQGRRLAVRIVTGLIFTEYCFRPAIKGLHLGQAAIRK